MLEEEEDIDNAINANFISVKPNFARKEIVGCFCANLHGLYQR